MLRVLDAQYASLDDPQRSRCYRTFGGEETSVIGDQGYSGPAGRASLGELRARTRADEEHSGRKSDSSHSE
jgi:hypothetical protein